MIHLPIATSEMTKLRVIYMMFLKKIMFLFNTKLKPYTPISNIVMYLSIVMKPL